MLTGSETRIDPPAIQVRGLGKCYRIGARARYQTLREALSQWAAASRVRLTGRSAAEGSRSPVIWALQEVSFDIQPGEAVGIIGRNGAGKSTLLKVLARITAPSRGVVDIAGRVGSMLEIGTGFHPELTGRENVYLNGAILGMRKAEIDRKFEEIVAFSEIETFIDTPVKHYSSGMGMRLAFSVAAHLEPEILLVDEVLAVGDALFQKKALGKMEQAAHGGRTVLFVSHNLDAVLALTRRGLVLQAGRLAYDGSSEDAVKFYRQSIQEGGSPEEYLNPQVVIGLRRARVTTSEANGLHQFGRPLLLEFEIGLNRSVMSFDFAFQVLNERAQPVINPRWIDLEHRFAGDQAVTIRCRIPEPRLYMGQYTLRTHLGDRASVVHHETVEMICPFEVVMDAASGQTAWLPGACAYVEDVDWQVGIG